MVVCVIIVLVIVLGCLRVRERQRKNAIHSVPKSFTACNRYATPFFNSLSLSLPARSLYKVPNGEAVPVTSENIHKYVELYAQQIMVEAIRPALVAMRAGLLDVVPHKTLSGLTAEDFRLLLNGCHAVDVELLERCTDFEEAGCKSSDLVAKTAKWVWAIVKEMTPAQQHDLIYFWTGSPSLPATEAGLVPRPSVHVRPASEGDAGMLPTSNTCISRILIPVYRSKEVRVLPPGYALALSPARSPPQPFVEMKALRVGRIRRAAPPSKHATTFFFWRMATF